MKRLHAVILGWLIFSSTICAQWADKKTHEQVAEKFMSRYNEKKYGQIYDEFSPSFKTSLSQKDFNTFMEESVYKPFGNIEKLEYLSFEKDQHVFILGFKATRLSMNLSVNNSNQIEGLQLLPYTEISADLTRNYLSDNKKLTGLDSTVDAVVQKFIQSPENCGISIAVSIKGRNYFYNYGETKRKNRTLPTQQTIYEIGSLTKTFCGVLLGMAVSENKIKSEDDIRKYLPGKYPALQSTKSAILVKHLANHTSGLESIPKDLLTMQGFDSLNPYKNYSRDLLLKYLATAQPATEPGVTSNYSNMGMALLGIILENVYGKDFETLVREKICLPNYMNATAVNLSVKQLQNFAEGYNALGAPTPHWDLNGFAAAGALKSSAEDMIRYLNYNLAEKNEATKLAHIETYSGREKVGYAWFIKKTNSGNTLIWHNGATFGFGSFAGFIKEKDCSLVILANSSTSLDFIGIAILKYLQR